MPAREDSSVQDKIKKKFENSNDFLPYIDEIRFPMYKSLESDLKISLEWPITALVGPNGTNKSSILQAISAAPAGRTLAHFWFSTEVDNIDSGLRKGATHRFIYKYTFDRSGTQAECRKYRGSKPYRSNDVPKPLQGKKDPDYWEPTKRVASDGMATIPETGWDAQITENRDRWKLIDKKVVYLDFRSELSAFDKYIHHQSFNHRTPDAPSKRYSAVVKSKLIARALKDERIPLKEQRKLINKVRHLPQEDVDIIANILGKPIGRISIVEHKFFGPTGYTIKLFLSESDTSYSEAHAGSGEYAVVRLVDEIRRSEKGSLILLDEPEVSLHPGAQVELLRFLEQEVLSKGHQVVFSTHSPFLVEGLPNVAIKVLGFDTTKERVVLIADGCSHTEAFAHLGQTISSLDKPRIIVEDDLVKEMVKASLRRQSPHKLDNLQIVPFPGGANGIVQNVLPSMAMSNIEKTGILLDGDQLPNSANVDQSVLKKAQQANLEDDLVTLREIWSKHFHETEINLFSDSDHASDAKNLYKCIIWAHKHLTFLPGEQPEQTLAIAENPTLDDDIPRDWKEYWRHRTGEEFNLTPQERDNISATEILQVQMSVLARFKDDNPLFVEIDKLVSNLVKW